MVAGSNLSWQGIKRKAVYTEGAGPVLNKRGSVHWKGVYRVGYFNNFFGSYQVFNYENSKDQLISYSYPNADPQFYRIVLFQLRTIH